MLKSPTIILSFILSSAFGVADEISKGAIQHNLERLSRVLELDLNSESAEPHKPDVAVFQKAVEWILRHDEFYDDSYFEQADKAIEEGLKRAEFFANDETPWLDQIGMTVRGYRSKVDGSIQPYAVTLPKGFDRSRAWPLHIVLHGRAGKMNEVNFIHKYNNKPPNEENTGWIQLDVFGRTNNAYRWSGETDVFEALEQVRQEYPIDENRIVLRGFSMGGAGAWHLGMHYPGLWCSVGPGAGFVDFYNYQKQSAHLPSHQHRTLGIYDSIDYALNAFNVPVCTYGGEEDPQLLAGQSMQKAAAQQSVDIKLIIGIGMGHRFDPGSRKEFLKFHVDAANKGRQHGADRKQIRFTTRTLRYNKCDWITIEEQDQPYEPSTATAIQNDHEIEVHTSNTRALLIELPPNGRRIIVDGVEIHGINSRSTSILLTKHDGSWAPNFASKFYLNPDRHKRRGLQGPIDDAFMEKFICVRGTGQPWSEKHQAYVDFVLGRFAGEYDKWLRAELPIVDDTIAISSKNLATEFLDANLILFGDPGSNRVIAEIIDKLPIEWNRQQINVNGQSYSMDDHAVSLIFPNPQNPARYVVINSGHTMHEKDFLASNAWLFPRLGDIAVQRFAEKKAGEFDEQTVWAAIFDSDWEFGP